ncbi:MAG: biosynthetic-type acetolactate synthase large subunit [Dehalococcoidia bacterium]
MRITGASAVCESLLKEGVDVIFGHPGGAVLPLYDALWHYPQIRHILVRHEQAGAHAAEAYARVTGKVGVCVATSGPGATNLMTGLAAAKMDSTPMVAITGQVARTFMGTEAFQECDTVSMARPVVKEAFLVMDGKDIAPTLHKAFRIAQEGRPGPVLVDIPKDVQAELTDFEYPSNGYVYMPPAPDAAQIAEAVRLLNDAERPLLIVGRGVHISKAWDEVLQLAEKANVPVLNTLHGTSAFPRHHRLALGMLGMHGMYWSNMATVEADLIMGVGIRFDDRVIGRPGTFGPNANIVHIEIDPSQVNKNVKASTPIVGDVKQVVTAMLPGIQTQVRSAWFERLDTLEFEHPSIDVPDSDIVTPQYVLRELNKLVEHSPDPVVVTGVGQHQMWTAQFMFMPTVNSFVSSGGLGVMGFEVPAAIGAQVGRPNSTVWSVAGDGGFQMTLQELATIAQEDLPIKIAIMNNGYAGMVRQWQELFYEHHYKSVSISGPDYVKLAESYGIKSCRVTEKNDVGMALAKAAEHQGPYLIDFRISPEENVYPMVPPGASLAETVEDPRVVHHRGPVHVLAEGLVSYP